MATDRLAYSNNAYLRDMQFGTRYAGSVRPRYQFAYDYLYTA